jgi:hypothetical protein
MLEVHENMRRSEHHLCTIQVCDHSAPRDTSAPGGMVEVAKEDGTPQELLHHPLACDFDFATEREQLREQSLDRLPSFIHRRSS